jgi:hypothetical protein
MLLMKLSLATIRHFAHQLVTAPTNRLSSQYPKGLCKIKGFQGVELNCTSDAVRKVAIDNYRALTHQLNIT